MEYKNIYLRHELPIADYLMSFQEKLRQEFLECHPDFIQGSFVKGEVVQQSQGSINNYGNWMVTNVQYKDRHIDAGPTPENEKYIPTAIALVKEFGEDCPIASYSVLKPHTCIYRHTGYENRMGKNIRIHIPLIVPQGDIFFETGGDVVRWDDIFAFNNQVLHSAHNYTDFWRVVFLIDIDRERVGLSPGRPYNRSRDEENQPPFYCRSEHGSINTNTKESI